jgi:hypothetical protein
MNARKMSVFVLIALLALVATPAMAQNTSCGVPQVQTLWGGQTINVGTVTVSNNDTTLYVTYNTTDAWYLTEVHLYVLNMAPTERLPPGQAPYKAENLPAGTQSYTFTVSLANLGFGVTCGVTDLWLQAHAAVVKLNAGQVVQSETAYGGDITNPDTGAWYGNIAYRVQCCEPSGGDCQEETAWGGATAGGGAAWWYYYDNATTSPDTQPIYAGQKLTDGDVTCNADGSLSINLGSWSLSDVDVDGNPVTEPVKVQCYQAGQLPARRPPAGQFTTFKGTALTIPGVCNTCRYIAIHLDVELCQ